MMPRETYRPIVSRPDGTGERIDMIDITCINGPQLWEFPSVRNGEHIHKSRNRSAK